jgi:type VI protein secretion system component VasK
MRGDNQTSSHSEEVDPMSLGWMKRTAAGFVLAALFFAMPFTEIGKDEPWYFWIGSGVVAFLVGILLTWIMIESQKPPKRRHDEENLVQQQRETEALRSDER